MNDRLADVLRKCDATMRMNAEIQRAHRDAMAAKHTAAAKDWRANNPERYAELRAKVVRNRNELFRTAAETATADELGQIAALLARWKDAPDWLCTYCHKDAPRCDRVADHVVPLSRGGKHAVSNLAPACRRCNSRKGTRSTYYA